MSSVVGVIMLSIVGTPVVPTNKCHRRNFATNCELETAFRVVERMSVVSLLIGVLTALAVLCFIFSCSLYLVNNND
jgi:hypothetical protein